MEPLASTSMYPISWPAPSLTILQRSTKAIRLFKETKDRTHFYILTVIGPFISGLKKKFVRLVTLCWWILVVMNGCDKMEPSVRKYYKFPEQLMVKHRIYWSVTVKTMKNIQEDYKQYQPKDHLYCLSGQIQLNLQSWSRRCQKFELIAEKSWQMFIISVGRFVPENNCKYDSLNLSSPSQKDFVLITKCGAE